MIVRPATAQDATALCALLNAIIATGGTTAHETPFTDDRFATHYITGPDVICCHLAWADGAIGFQGLSSHPDLPDGWADIGTFVAPPARGTGAGAALFAATRAFAQALGFTGLNATIRADNAPGLGYYARLGFQDLSSDPGYCLQDGRRVGRINRRLALA